MANKQFKVPINLVNLASDPGTASEGDIYYNTASDVVRVYANGAWASIGSGGGASLTQEEVQDYVSPLFTHANHTNASVTYEDASNELRINVVNAPSAGYTSTLKHDVKLNGSIAKGQAVYVSSANGTNIIVSKSSNATEATSSKTLGLLETGGANNDIVKVVAEGLLAGLDTSTATAGDPVWLGTNGNLIYGFANKPYGPAHLVFIGIVTRVNANNGEIFVKVQNGFELEEIHNVGIGYGATIADNEVLAYDTTTSQWINQTPAEAGLLDTSATAQTKAGDLTITGNLTVNGTTTTFNTEQVYIEDNLITLNSNVTGAPSGTAGIEIERGTSTNTSILWSEANQSWNFSNDINVNILRGTGTLQLATTATAGTSGPISLLTAFSEIEITSTGIISLKAGNVDGFNTYKFAKTYFEFPDLTQQTTAFRGMSYYSTTNLSEGTNLYFTNERAVSALASTLTGYLTTGSASSSYQPLDSDLTAIAALTANGFLKKTAGVWGMDTTTYATSGDISSAVGDYIPLSQKGDNLGVAELDNDGFVPVAQIPVLTAYSSSSHNHTLNSLSNVVITSATDGQALVWDTTTSKWVNETVVQDLSGYQPLDSDLTDIAALSANGFLKKAAGVWAMDASTYLTSYTETDTLSSVTNRGATTSDAITISNTTQSTTPTSGALIISGGVGIAKDVWIDGDLHVNGTTITENTQTVATHDNLIYLNAAQDTTITNAVGNGTYVTYTAENNYTPGMDIRVTGMNPSGYNISSADLLTVYSATSTQFVVAKTTTGTFVSGGTAHAKEEANPDLGFAGGYYNAGYAHAGLFRDATDGVFKFFDGYTPEPDEAVNIDTTHASFALADISANDATFTGEAKVGGAIVKTTITSITPSSTTVIAGFPYQDSVGGVVVAECIVLLSSTSDGSYYTSKILVGGGYPAGTPTANLTEYAIIEDGSMDVTFTADLGSLGGGGGGNTHVFLKALVTNSNVTAKVISTSITASNAAT